MNQTIFDCYEVARAQGNKRLASSLISEFVASFSTLEDRSAWTHWYFSNRTFEHTVRHELFEHVIFPVLLKGYKCSDPWSLQWLERCEQNLYKAKQLWAQVDHKSADKFLEELIAVEPNNLLAKQRLLSHRINSFRYCEHEWPAGILFGMDGANYEQCEEILQSIEHTNALDTERAYSNFLAEFESKVRQYLARLVKARAN